MFYQLKYHICSLLQKLIYENEIVCLSECDLGTYGDKCNETCGNCLDLNECHHSNGTCLTGCKAGYDGALCKTRKYVKHCKYIYSKVCFRFILPPL